MKETKISKKEIEEVAKSQPMSYFKKFESIVVHNLRISHQRADWERNRTDGDYSITALVIEQFETKHIRVSLNLVKRVIRAKKKMLQTEKI